MYKLSFFALLGVAITRGPFATGAEPPRPPIAPGPAGEAVLGDEMLESFLAARPLSGDGALALRVGRVGHSLSRVSDRPDVVDSFLVVIGKELQAYSFTGGTVCLTDTLARLFSSDDELAFALAHELAHVTLRHHVSESVFRQSLTAGKASHRPAVESLYSQSAELEADRYGALYACRAGYRFSAAVDALDRLTRAMHGRDGDANHPAYAERAKLLARQQVELENSIEAFERGKTALVAGRADEAVDMLKLFTASFPQSVAGQVDLGSAFLARARAKSGSPGELEEVVPFLPEAGVVVRGTVPELDVQRAKEHFRRALSLSPEDPVATVGLALALVRLADFAGARAELERQLARTGDAPELFLCLGNTEYLAGEHRRAVDRYAQALVLKPQWPAATKNLALAWEALGEPLKARPLWEALVADDKVGPEARRHLAHVAPPEPR
jgi:predicted Zn-dependent protease